MKKFCFLLILILLSCEPKCPLTLKIEKIGKLQNKINNEKIKIYAPDKSGYKVIASVKNNFYRPIYFWMWSCSYQAAFKTNFRAVKKIGNPICDQNYPSKFELQPGRSQDYEFLLLLSDVDRASKNAKDVRLGLIFVDDIFTKKQDTIAFKNFTKIGTVEEKPAFTKKIVWSDPIDLSK